RPGIAVGGHCIPVYPYFLINDAGENEMSLPSAARRINDAMSGWALDLTSTALGGLEGKRILILGLSYRENVKETAFSGAIRLIAELKAAGAIPMMNDPLYTNEEVEHFGAKAVSLDDLPEGDAVILQAYHDDYRALDWRLLTNKGYKVLLDGRNSLDRAEIKSAGMQYIGMGR
ncbi:MAG: UDP binding domain-containing protein, partial [Chloroflexia bacterium]